MLVKLKSLVLGIALMVAMLVPTFATAQAEAEPTSFLKRTFVFPDNPPVEVSAELSAVPLWTVVSNGSNPDAAPSTWCNAWVPAKGIAGWTLDDCVLSITEVSAAIYDYQLPADRRQWYRFWSTRPSNFVYLVPSFAADQAVMLARAEADGGTDEMVDDPTRLAELFREELTQLREDLTILQGDVGTMAEAMGEMSQDIKTLKDTSVAKTDVPGLVDDALRDSGALRDIRASDKEAVEVYVAEQLAALPETLSQDDVTGLIETAMANLGIPQAVIDTAVATAMDEFETRLNDVEALAKDNFETLKNKADQSAVDDLSDRVGAVEKGLNDLQGSSSTSVWGIPAPTWLALLLSVLALIGVGLLAKRKSSKNDLSAVTTTADEAKKKAQSAEDKAGEAQKTADKAHDLAARASQEVRMINFNLPDGWQPVGNFPTKEEVEAVPPARTISLRFWHDSGEEREFVFTKVEKAFKDGGGNMRDGLKPAHADKPIAARPLKMLGSCRTELENESGAKTPTARVARDPDTGKFKKAG